MSRIFIRALLLFHSSICLGQKQVFKFDFGNGKIAPGFTGVTSQTIFDHKSGYGFEKGSEMEDVNRDADPLTGDFVTGKNPFYFSVLLPEGNYNLKLWLGDAKGISATTVRTECRRLMLENIRTEKGKISMQSFTVHVRDSLIRDGKGKPISQVRLKPREKDYRHWDNLLTIEFNDSLPKICALEITPALSAVTLFLAGNSTVVDQDREPWAAWGQMFPRFLIPGKAVVANYAESGETLKAFRTEKRLEKIFSIARAGDYLFIEFTHNDQKPGGNHLDAFTTYKQTLAEWIAEARKRKIIPVLVTSMHRRNFDSSGKIINTLEGYPEAMRETAREEKIALIDLNRMSKILYESWGPEKSLKAFVHYPANSFPNQPEELKDNTHFSPYGAYELAKCVVSSILKQKGSLANFIRKDFGSYEPARPGPVEDFYWPQSTLGKLARPDGN